VGDYRVLDLLGSGGMGHVYKVQNSLSNRVEAMKVVLPDKADELTERFLREIQVQASLVHPNITGLHTALRVDGQLVMIMELVEGESVKDRLERGPLRVGECLEYGRQILDALAYAHRQQVVHRDIKPANIMLSTVGQAKLMDFGLASAAFDRRLTRSGMVMGSLYYMAPEQVKGQALSPKSDLYSFGLTLYEMLTGVRGIQGDSDYAIMTAQLQVMPEPPARFNPSVSEGLSDLVLRAIAKDPEDRFASAEKFRDALEQFAREAPEPVMEAVATESKKPSEKREPGPPPSVTSTNLKPDPRNPIREAPPEAPQIEAPPARSQGKKSGIPIVAGVAAAVALAAAGIYRFATKPPSAPEAPPLTEIAGTKQPDAGLITPRPPVEVPSSAVTSSAKTTQTIPPSTSASPGSSAPLSPSPANTSIARTAPTNTSTTALPDAKRNAAIASPAPAAPPVSAPVEKAPARSPVSVATAAPAPGPLVEPPKAPQKSAEQLMAEDAARAWELIASSNDPTVLRSFQSKYPQSAQAAEAVARAGRLETEAAAAAAARAAAEGAATLRKEVVATLQRLELAYSARNMLQIRLVWPTIEEDHVSHLEQVFRESRMVSLTLEPRMDPRATPTGAIANCRYVLAMPLKGPNGPRRVEGFAMVRFKRANGALLVDSIEYRVTNKSLYSPL